VKVEPSKRDATRPGESRQIRRTQIVFIVFNGANRDLGGEPRPDVPNLPGKTFLGKNQEKVSRFRSVFELCVAACVSLERLIGDVGMPFA
jgi:hypothetical protein